MWTRAVIILPAILHAMLFFVSAFTRMYCTRDLKGTIIRHKATNGSFYPQVTRVMLLWVNNHFTDFEGDVAMENYLVTFEKGLELQVRLANHELISTNHIALE